jgi:hypothetical protein
LDELIVRVNEAPSDRVDVMVCTRVSTHPLDLVSEALLVNGGPGGPAIVMVCEVGIAILNDLVSVIDLVQYSTGGSGGTSS